MWGEGDTCSQSLSQDNRLRFQSILESVAECRLGGRVDARGTSSCELVPPAERLEVLRETLGWWPLLEKPLAKILAERAARLAQEHGRLADLVGSSAKLMQIEPQSPPDLLGLVVLLPVLPGGVSR